MPNGNDPCPSCGIAFGIGDWPICPHGRVPKKDAQPHVRERATVYFNPKTGEHRTPPRSDMPMPEVYRRQGFERTEIMNMGKYEKRTGAIHEDSNFHKGNAEDSLNKEPERKKTDPKVIRDLVNALR